MTVGDLYIHLDAQFLGRSPEPGREVCYIDYAHVVGGVVYHGMLSNADGPAQATWCYQEGGRTVTLERVIDDRTFEQLFVGIGVLPAFRHALCNDMGRPVDYAAAHVVSHVWPNFDQGVWGRCVCLVPADEADKDFGIWLRLLDRPGGAA